MSQNMISLRIHGNPGANSGFMPLVLLNNPTFNIPDNVEAGLSMNSRYFTFCIEADKIVYKLVKNNVHSYGAARIGALAIAISVPKGYVIRAPFTPYSVLNNLFDEFKQRCMNCRDSVNEVYEYNSDHVDPHVMDDVLGRYALEPHLGPWVAMNNAMPRACFIAEEKRIAELLRDVQFPEFKNVSSVIAAQQGGVPGAVNVSHLEVPRKIMYTIVINGKTSPEKITDVNKLLTCTLQPTTTTEAATVTFTVAQAVNRQLAYAQYDPVTETVSVKIIPAPKEQILKVVVPEGSEEIYNEPGLKFEIGNTPVAYDSATRSVKLRGEQIVHAKQITMKGYNPDVFSLQGIPMVSGDKIDFRVEKKKPKRQARPAPVTMATGEEKAGTSRAMLLLAIVGISCLLIGAVAGFFIGRAFPIEEETAQTQIVEGAEESGESNREAKDSEDVDNSGEGESETAKDTETEQRIKEVFDKLHNMDTDLTEIKKISEDALSNKIQGLTPEERTQIVGYGKLVEYIQGGDINALYSIIGDENCPLTDEQKDMLAEFRAKNGTDRWFKNHYGEIHKLNDFKNYKESEPSSGSSGSSGGSVKSKDRKGGKGSASKEESTSQPVAKKNNWEVGN